MSIAFKIGRFQFQGGTKAELEASDLILLDREPCFEQDTGKFKVGDGRRKYKDLRYVSIGQIDFKNATPEQLKLVTGPKGEKGDPMTYDMLTAEQRLEIKGKDGTISIEDMTEDQKIAFAKEFGVMVEDRVADEVQKIKDLNFDSEAKYQDDMIYILNPYIEAGEVKFKAKEIGRLLENDFLKVPVNADKMRFRIKSSSQGIILLYSLTDDSLQYAIHVYPNIKDYEIDFGRVIDEELIFTSVTMPEDKVSVIREEGLASGN